MSAKDVKLYLRLVSICDGVNMTAKNKEEKEKDRSLHSRGAKDDWEALKIVLEDLPSLRQRVLHKLRDLKNKKARDNTVKISAREQREMNRSKNRK